MEEIRQSLRMNSFAVPELKSVSRHLRDRGSLITELYQIQGMVFKQVVYHKLSDKPFIGSLFGLVHYVTLMQTNVSMQRLYKNDIITHGETHRMY
jgi:hypothetical protein